MAFFSRVRARSSLHRLLVWRAGVFWSCLEKACAAFGPRMRLVGFAATLSGVVIYALGVALLVSKPPAWMADHMDGLVFVVLFVVLGGAVPSFAGALTMRWFVQSGSSSVSSLQKRSAALAQAAGAKTKALAERDELAQDCSKVPKPRKAGAKRI